MFYNLYFRADDKIVMMFPHSHDARVLGMIPARICPDCMQVKLGEDGTDECIDCGVKMIDIMISNSPQTSGTKNHKQYVCPCCGSRRGLALIGLRSLHLSLMMIKRHWRFQIMFKMLRIEQDFSIQELGALVLELRFKNIVWKLDQVKILPIFRRAF